MSAFLRRLGLLRRMERRNRRLYAEAYIRLGWARLLLYVKFAKVAPSLGERWAESASELPSAQIPVVRDVALAVSVMSKYTLWDSKCLVRAMACMKMLERRGIESTLYLGTAKDEHGALIAHAWLRSGPYYVSGADVMEKFITVDKYANTAKA